MEEAMKNWAGASLLTIVILGATLATAQEKESGASFKYRVVRMPPNIVETEYNTIGKSRKPAARPIYPLDELSAEGWELVTVVRVDGAKVQVPGAASAEADGGDFICFLRRRK